MIIRRIDNRTLVILAKDHETEIGRVVLPEGGASIAEIERFIDHLKREALRKAPGPS